MPETTSLSPTLEDYLEAICRLVSEKGEAHVNDIAAATSVHKSTVTAALKSLSDKRLVAYAPYQAATLTPKGRQVADEIIRRHEVVRDFLRNVLGVPDNMADDNACRMEHAMDAEVLNRLTLFIRFVWECPRAGEDWVEHFRQYFESGGEHRIDAQEAMEWADRFKESIRHETDEGRGSE